MCDKGRPERVEDADDDVWEEGFDDGPAERIELDREWETRHQQFYNVRVWLLHDFCEAGHLHAAAAAAQPPPSSPAAAATAAAAAALHITHITRLWFAFLQSGYREGLDEGKELTLQCGFNAGVCSVCIMSLYAARLAADCLSSLLYIDCCCQQPQQAWGPWSVLFMHSANHDCRKREFTRQPQAMHACVAG
jgi:hypothetical protein